MSKDDFLTPAELKKQAEEKLARREAAEAAERDAWLNQQAAELEAHEMARRKAHDKQIAKLKKERYPGLKATAHDALAAAATCTPGEKRAPHGDLLRPDCSRLQDYGECLDVNHYRVRLAFLGRLDKPEKYAQEDQIIQEQALLVMLSDLESELKARGYKTRLELVNLGIDLPGYYFWIEWETL
jgi:hypothetical protein